MKTFGTCSNCLKEHYWREIDFDNLLYISVDKAVCLTLCPICTDNFLQQGNKESIRIFYRQNINAAINGKTKPVFDFNLGNQPNTFAWRLAF